MGNDVSFINYFFDIDCLWQIRGDSLNYDWLLLTNESPSKDQCAGTLENSSEDSYKTKMFLSDDQRKMKSMFITRHSSKQGLYMNDHSGYS